MKTKPDTWKRTESEKIADCRVFTVRRDESERETDGAKAAFFVIENPDWVNVIALTVEKEAILIEQFRHGSEEIVLEIPGGMVDEDELPEKAARRELLEETGYASDEFIFLGKSRPNPAIQNNWIHHFVALDCRKVENTNFDEHESIFTRTVALSEVKNLIETGEFTHALAVTAFYYLSLKISEY